MYNANMKILLTTLNAKFIHKNLALRWLYVASPMKENTYIKEYTIKDDINRIANEIICGRYDVVCFSCYIWNIEETKKIIQLIKQEYNPKILIGGPEVSFESEYLLDEGVDAICIGEGEKANWEYIQSLDHPHPIEGIITKEFKTSKYAYCDLKENEMYENPYFLDMDLKDMKNRYLYLETSRGCPYNCAYCLSSTDKKLRIFSEDYVMNTLERIKNSEIRQVKLLDRTFNCMPERALKIARYMNEECKNQIFQFEIVAETLSEQLIDFFIHEADKKRFRFEVGVQSFNQKTLQAVGRYQDNDKLKRVMKRLIDAGCILHVDLIAGLPYEDLESFKQSFNELFSVHAAELQCGILKLLKGTALKRKDKEYGYVYETKPPYSILKTNWLSEEDLIRINYVAYAVEKFYNSNKLRRSIDLLLELGYFSNAFDLFYECGLRLSKYERHYYDHDLVMILKEITKNDLRVDAILLSDYMALHKQKPKKLELSKVSKEEIKDCYNKLIEKGCCHQKECYHYGRVEYYYDSEICYQVLIYNHEHTYPTRWIIKGEEIYEKRIES